MRRRRGWGAQADGAPDVDGTQRSDHQSMSRLLLGDTQAARGPWWRTLAKRGHRRLAGVLLCITICLAGAHLLGVLPWPVNDHDVDPSVASSQLKLLNAFTNQVPPSPALPLLVHAALFTAPLCALAQLACLHAIASCAVREYRWDCKR
jgi:hypothetical protein